LLYFNAEVVREVRNPGCVISATTIVRLPINN
jgi:hypothetical protein